MLANGVHRYHDKACSLVCRIGGTSSVLLGYRPVGHDTSPEGFGSFRPHALSFGRVRQLTININTNRLQLHLGGNAANERGPTGVDAVRFEFTPGREVGGSPLTGEMLWSEPDMRFQSDNENNVRTWLENHTGVPVKVVLSPVVK